jgi:hypothetical protein
MATSWRAGGASDELGAVAEALCRADDLTSLPPLPPEGAAPEGSALLPDEDQPVRARLGVALQMPAGLPAEERGKKLDRLHSLLAPARTQGTANTVVISAIGGATGIGKTALSVH